MRVLCVNDEHSYKAPITETGFWPEVGKSYETIMECVAYSDDDIEVNCYELANDPGYGYPIEMFIPCSNMDERELVNEEWNVQECDATK